MTKSPLATATDPRAAAIAYPRPDRTRAKPIGETPEGAEAFTVPSPAGDIAVWRWGRGTPVLLVHGWEGNRREMLGFVAPLLAAGLSPVALDLPGHGTSGGEVAAMPEISAAIRAVGAAVGPAAGIIGHSVGAASTVLALHEGLLARRAVLVGPPSSYAFHARRIGGLLGFAPDFADQMVVEMDRLGSRASEMEMTAFAPHMKVPALILHSRDDQTVSIEEGRLAARLWPGARIAEFDGLGHFKILADPEAIAAAVGWISGA